MDLIDKDYEFFLAKHKTGENFTLDEMAKETGRTKGTVETYISKKWQDVVKRVSNAGEEYRVSPRFAGVGRRQFRALYPQKQRLFAEYRPVTHDAVLVYDFFSPAVV